MSDNLNYQTFANELEPTKPKGDVHNEQTSHNVCDFGNSLANVCQLWQQRSKRAENKRTYKL